MFKLLFTSALLLFTGTTSLTNFKVDGIDGNTIDFAKYKGKKVLIVNTASECGYTKQYKDLQSLYDLHKDKLVIVAFPANNFGAQEPGSNSEIKEFCKKNYGVTFPVAAKVSVKGYDIHPFFKWMTEQTNPDFIGEIKWNFEKFLFDENGMLLHRYRSKTNPMGEEIIAAITK
jgi:glutathione peroxidase